MVLHRPVELAGQTGQARASTAMDTLRVSEIDLSWIIRLQHGRRNSRSTPNLRLAVSLSPIAPSNAAPAPGWPESTRAACDRWGHTLHFSGSRVRGSHPPASIAATSD